MGAREAKLYARASRKRIEIWIIGLACAKSHPSTARKPDVARYLSHRWDHLAQKEKRASNENNN